MLFADQCNRWSEWAMSKRKREQEIQLGEEYKLLLKRIKRAAKRGEFELLDSAFPEVYRTLFAKNLRDEGFIVDLVMIHRTWGSEFGIKIAW